MSVVAQSPSPRVSARPRSKEAAAKNQAALRQHLVGRDHQEVSLKGEVKKKEQKQCSYGADGKVQKTPVGGARAGAARAEGRRRRPTRWRPDERSHRREQGRRHEGYMEKVAALGPPLLRRRIPRRFRRRRERETLRSHRPAAPAH